MSEASAPPVGAFAASPDASQWTFDGALTFDNAAAALDASRELELPVSGRIDLSGLRALDSAAIAVLFALKRRATAEQCNLAFVGMPPGLLSLARVYGVDGLLA